MICDRITSNCIHPGLADRSGIVLPEARPGRAGLLSEWSCRRLAAIPNSLVPIPVAGKPGLAGLVTIGQCYPATMWAGVITDARWALSVRNRKPSPLINYLGSVIGPSCWESKGMRCVDMRKMDSFVRDGEDAKTCEAFRTAV